VSAETNGKCAYCESKVDDVYVGDVEHMLPKANDPKRTLDYDNLTFACWRCNNKKRNIEFRDGLPVLNPYEDSGDFFFRFCGFWLRPVKREPDEIRAQRTIDTMDLNRTGLTERREFQYKRYESLEASYYRASHPAVRDSAIEEIRAAQASGSEDSLLARQFFRNVDFRDEVAV
jgi:uncharacterized protein (TIGR02646 family)